MSAEYPTTSLRQLCPQRRPVPARSGRRGRRQQPRADPGALPGVQGLSYVSRRGTVASIEVHSRTSPESNQVSCCSACKTAASAVCGRGCCPVRLDCSWMGALHLGLSDAVLLRAEPDMLVGVEYLPDRTAGCQSACRCWLQHNNSCCDAASLCILPVTVSQFVPGASP